MSERVHNFGAGPSVLPEVVLQEAREQLMSLPGVGMSVLEISHRSSTFTGILDRATSNVRKLAGLTDDYHVLFMQGGASQQFAMVPINLLPVGGVADYTVTGTWAKKAAQEAARFGTVRIAATTEEDRFSRIPSKDALDLSADAAYVHVTSNNTIVGTQWPRLPETGHVPLVVDASSDIFSRPLDVIGSEDTTGNHNRIGLLYAGAQKNLGPAGVTLVIVHASLVERASVVGRTIPTTLEYSTYVKSGSLHNTPPVFAIYVVALVTDWLLAQGGLDVMQDRNLRKAQALYDAIDRSDFYRGTADPDSRSQMNVTFRLPDEDLETRFVSAATAAGLVGLKGHRSVGGIRASIYNAIPESAVEALVAFMTDFERSNG